MFLKTCVCAYVCHAYMCARVYVCTRVYASTRACRRACMYTHTYARVCMRIRVNVVVASMRLPEIRWPSKAISSNIKPLEANNPHPQKKSSYLDSSPKEKKHKRRARGMYMLVHMYARACVCVDAFMMRLTCSKMIISLMRLILFVFHNICRLSS